MKDKLPKEIEKGESTIRNKKTVKRLRRWGLILLLCFFLIAFGGVVGIVFQPPGLKAFLRTFNIQPGSGTSSPIAVSIEKIKKLEQHVSASQPNDVVGLGTILPVSEVVTISLPYGANDASIKELHVVKGQQVEKDQKLATLDSYPELAMKIRQAKNTVQVKKATLKQTINQVRANLAESQALLEKAKAKASNEHNEYKRIKELYRKKVVSKSQLDLQLAKKDQAEKEISQAKANISRYQSEKIEDQVDVMVALQNLAVSKSQYGLAKTELSRSELRAPFAGTILDILAFPGEKPSSDGVFVVGNLEKMLVRAEIYQTDIARIKVGASAKIRAVSLNEVLNGTVTSIGLQVKKQTRILDNPAAKTDARVVEVDIILDNHSSKIASKYTNMQVVALIKTSNSE